MKKSFGNLAVWFVILTVGAGVLTAEAQESGILQNQTGIAGIPGAPPDYVPEEPTPAPAGKIARSSASGSYTTYTYTLSDLVIFSYSDNNEINVLNSSGGSIWSGTLNSNEYHSLSPGSGVYSVAGSQPFSLLIGDPISHYVIGYYAMNEQGYGVGTKFLTYMPQYISQAKFIVFGYTDNTEVQIKDLSNDTVIWTGVLDRGEHYANPDIQSQFLLVTGSEPVSALSYNDQGYLIPADSGLWTGTHFFGYAGYVGSWANDLNIISYEDGASVTLTNSDTEQTIWSGTLNAGEMQNVLMTPSLGSEVYFEITSDKNVSASISPYTSFTSSYAHLLDCTDPTGKRIGTLFYVPGVSNGRIDFSSFEDGNDVTITNMNTSAVQWSGTLNAGEHTTINTSNVLYKIEGTGPLSGCESCSGTAGGSFMPVYYGLELPDLIVSSSSIYFTPESPAQGEQVDIEAVVSNLGNNSAFNVQVEFFDGDPDEGGVKIGSTQTISQVAANGGTGTASVLWTTPEGADYRQIFVVVDRSSKITESNESNNKASKPLIPNEDLQPPLTVTVDAPSGLTIDDTGAYTPDPAVITVNISNSGTGTALNTTATLNLPDGLALKSGEEAVISIGSIGVSAAVSVTWNIEATGDPFGDLLYSITVDADNADAKSVKRALHVPEAPFEADVYASWDGEFAANADIYVNRESGFEKVGTTGSAGEPVHVTNLTLGTQVRAEKLLHTEASVKDNHEAVDDTMFELWVDSDIMESDGSYQSIEIPSQSESFAIDMDHPIFKYNLVVSIEWDGVTEDYFTQLEEGYKYASQYLYDITDGQAHFNKIAIYQNKVNWDDCDVQIKTEQWPQARVNGIDDDGFLFFKPGKIYMGRQWGGAWPDESTYYRTIIHEFGHYAFGLYDEYLNGLGIKDQWKKYRSEHPDECPQNYGFMDYQYNISEASSHNDYLQSYPTIYGRWTVSEQLDERKMPCWDWIKHKLETYYSDVDITLPPSGWFPDGYRFDRDGPDNDGIRDKTTVIDNRTETAKLATLGGGGLPFESRILVVRNGDPVPAAHVYVSWGNHRMFLGKTGVDGFVDAPGMTTGAGITVYKTTGQKMLSRQVEIAEAADPIVVTLDSPTSAEKIADQTGDPGIVLDADISSSGNDITLDFSLLADVALAGNPSVQIYYGEVSEAVSFSQVGLTNEYTGSVTIDGAAPGFDGTGYLDGMIVGPDSHESLFTSYFTIYALSTDDLNRVFLRGLLSNFEEENISEQQVGVSLATLELPYTPASQTLYPVTEMFTLSFENDNSFSDDAGLNVYYIDSEVAGIDERTLGLYSWNASSNEWDIMEDSTIDIEGNVVSVEIEATGIYSIFATALSTDTTVPEKTEDLDAETGQIHGEIQLNWTAPGDDGDSGQASNYIVRFSEVPINSTNWDQCLDVPNEPAPAEAGTSQSMTVSMPVSNTLYYFAMKTEDEAGNISPLSNFTAAVSSAAQYTFSLVSPVFDDTPDTNMPTFTWEPLSGETDVTYTLWYGVDETFEVKNEITDITDSEYQLTSALSDGSTYYWKVIAVTSSGDVPCNQAFFKISYAATGDFSIDTIEDVLNDQGKQVSVSWFAHPYDSVNAGDNVIHKYTIWRKIDPDLPAVWKSSVTPEGSWHFITEVPAVQDNMYHAVVPTLADSTVNNGVYFSTFFVRAHTDDPTEHYETAAASGYSVDNLSPEPVDDITVQYKVAGITVEWSPSDAPDVGLYKVFKSDISDFEPDESTFIGTSVETTFTEEGAVEGEAFYKIAAIDFSGNSGLSDPYRFVLLPSPSNITIVDTPDDQGHFIGISWTAPEDNSGLIEEYRIYRSRSEILTDAVPMIQFASIDALNEYEANNTVLVTTVDANVTAIDDFVPIGGESYYYWIQAVGSLGASKIATADVITRIVEMPGEFSLSAAYPNPFNPSTTLEYSIPAESHISLVVYDALGRKVAILVDGIMKPGSYTAVWDGRDESGSMLGSGLYIYRFTAGSFTAQGKVMFLR